MIIRHIIVDLENKMLFKEKLICSCQEVKYFENVYFFKNINFGCIVFQ